MKYKKNAENYRAEFDYEFDLDSYQPTSDFHPYRHKIVSKNQPEEKNKVKENIK